MASKRPHTATFLAAPRGPDPDQRDRPYQPGECAIARVPGAFFDGMPFVILAVEGPWLLGEYQLRGGTVAVPLRLRTGQVVPSYQVVDGVPIPAGPECEECGHEPCPCCTDVVALCDVPAESGEGMCPCMATECRHPPGVVAAWMARVRATIERVESTDGVTACALCEAIQGFDGDAHLNCVWEFGDATFRL